MQSRDTRWSYRRTKETIWYHCTKSKGSKHLRGKVAKRTGCNSQHETKTPTADLAHFWEQRNVTWEKIRRQTTIRRRGEGKEVHHHERNERKRKEGGRDVAMSLVLRLLHAREGASLLSFRFFPRAPQSTTDAHPPPFTSCSLQRSRPVPTRPVPSYPSRQ